MNLPYFGLLIKKKPIFGLPYFLKKKPKKFQKQKKNGGRVTNIKRDT